MKHFLSQLFKTPMFLVFLLVVVIYGFPALGQSAEINRYGIVTAIGIDGMEDDSGQYEVSFLMFVPIADQSFRENYRVVTSNGKNIAEAVDYAGLHVGREIGLSHIKMVVLNSNLLQNDVTTYLDYLSRSQGVTSSTRFVATDSSAKDFLLAAQKLDSESAIKISDIISYNQNYIYSVDSSFETFFKGTLGPTKVSLVPFLHLETSGDNGFMVSSDSTGGQDSQSQQPGGQSASGNSAEDIVNNGDTFVLKNATYQILLDGDEMEKINFLNGSFNMGSIEVENVEDETFKNANLSFDIEDKKLDFKVTFENNVPTIYVQLQLNLKLREVEDDGVVAENIGENSLSNVVVEAVEKKVRKNMAEAVKIMRENQIDIPNFYTMMHNSNKKAFRRFLEGLEDKEDYLNYVVFKSSVKVLMK